MRFLIFICILMSLLSSSSYSQENKELAKYYAKCAMAVQMIVITPGLNDTNKKTFQELLDIYRTFAVDLSDKDVMAFDRNISDIAPSIRQMSLQQLADIAEQCNKKTISMTSITKRK